MPNYFNSIQYGTVMFVCISLITLITVCDIGLVVLHRCCVLCIVKQVSYCTWTYLIEIVFTYTAADPLYFFFTASKVANTAHTTSHSTVQSRLFSILVIIEMP